MDLFCIALIGIFRKMGSSINCFTMCCSFCIIYPMNKPLDSCRFFIYSDISSITEFKTKECLKMLLSHLFGSEPCLFDQIWKLDWTIYLRVLHIRRLVRRHSGPRSNCFWLGKRYAWYMGPQWLIWKDSQNWHLSYMKNLQTFNLFASYVDWACSVLWTP